MSQVQVLCREIRRLHVYEVLVSFFSFFFNLISIAFFLVHLLGICITIVAQMKQQRLAGLHESLKAWTELVERYSILKVRKIVSRLMRVMALVVLKSYSLPSCRFWWLNMISRYNLKKSSSLSLFFIIGERWMCQVWVWLPILRTKKYREGKSILFLSRLYMYICFEIKKSRHLISDK